MKQHYGIIGAGGYGREVMPMARSYLQKNLVSKSIQLCFVAENPGEATSVNDSPLLSLSEFLSLAHDKKFSIAIGNSKARERIATVCKNLGATPFSIKADNAVIMDKNRIGPGSIISPFVTITSNVTIGSFFHANLYSYIAHDCIIGDFVTLAPAAKCNGNVIIEDHVYIGTGAILKPGSQERPLIIGKGAIVGMGAVVTKDVQPFTTVIGNPARPLLKP